MGRTITFGDPYTFSRNERLIAKENYGAVDSPKNDNLYKKNIQKPKNLMKYATFEIDDTNSISNRSINKNDGVEKTYNPKLNFEEIFYPKLSNLDTKNQQKSNENMYMSEPIKADNTKNLESEDSESHSKIGSNRIMTEGNKFLKQFSTEVGDIINRIDNQDMDQGLNDFNKRSLINAYKNPRSRSSTTEKNIKSGKNQKMDMRMVESQHIENNQLPTSLKIKPRSSSNSSARHRYNFSNTKPINISMKNSGNFMQNNKDLDYKTNINARGKKTENDINRIMEDSAIINKLKEKRLKNSSANATVSNFVQSQFLRNEQQKNENYKNRTQNTPRQNYPSTYNSMMTKMRDRGNNNSENQSKIDEDDTKSKASWKIGVMGSHYNPNNKDLNDSHIAIDKIYSKLLSNPSQNLLFFKSASLFNESTLYSDEHIEIKISSKLYDSSNSESVKFSLCFINNSNEKLIMQSNIDMLPNVRATPNKIEKIFDQNSKMITQQVIITNDISKQAPSNICLSIELTFGNNQSKSFTISLPCTINKFLFHDKVSQDAFSFGNNKKELLCEDMFEFNKEILSSSNNLPKLMDEVNMISYKNDHVEYGAIYKFMGQNLNFYKNENSLGSRRNRESFRKNKTNFETFYVKFSFDGEDFMNVQIYGDQMNLIISEYMKWIKYIFFSG